jgi:hypothetical protein
MEEGKARQGKAEVQGRPRVEMDAVGRKVEVEVATRLKREHQDFCDLQVHIEE